MRPAAYGVIVSVAAATIGLTGCSGSEPAPQLDVTAASAVTSVLPTATPSAIGSVNGSELAGRVRAALAKARSARFSLQSSTTSGQDATGVLNVLRGRVSVRFDFTDGTDKLRVIAFPGVLYADVGTAVDGRHWLKVTAQGTDPLSSAMAPLLSYMTNSADVSSQTSTWAAAGAFRVSGATSVGGVQVTEYAGTIPLAAVQAGLPAQFRDIMKKDITGDSNIQVWLDAQDRPVKVVTAGNYDHKAGLVTVTYSGWGQAPKVTAPPGSDIITARS